MKKYDSKKDTTDHILKVIKNCDTFMYALNRQVMKHDASKLETPEKEIFDEYTPKLKDCTYNSKEYKIFLEEMKVALNHHYENNRHHPEHFEKGIQDMDLIDIVEMLMDWWASAERHKDGNIFKSIEINQKRFGYSDDLKNIMLNTIASINLYKISLE